MPFGGYLNDPSEDYTYKDLGLKLSRGKDPLEPNKIEREWGCLIHPDEMRQILFIGNGRLITSGGDQITDNQLKNWVDQSVRALSDLLKWDIYPRLWRHRPFHDQERIIEPYAEWEDMYDYHYKHSDLFFVSLRRKPVCKIINWRLASPYNRQTMIDLMPKMIPNYGAGILKSAVYIGGAGFNMTVSQYRSTILRQDLPSSYQVDYVSGYDHADRVPRDLREIVQKLMIINVMSAFGDGVVSGMSNYSISLGPLSESIGTTMSASIGYEDKVKIKSKRTGQINDIEIGLFTDLCNGGNLNYGDFQTLAVNPKDITNIEWKDILGVYEHDTSKKVSYELSSSLGRIRATEDHSLFNVSGNELVETKTAEIVKSFKCAVLLYGAVNNYPVLSATKIHRDKMYDLSVDQFENFIVNDYFIAHNTSAYFGARIAQMSGEIKDWLKTRGKAYTGIGFRGL